MGYSITKNSNQVAYGVKEFVVDTINDLDTLYGGSPGSTAFCISNSTKYMFNTKKKWVPVKTESAGISESDEIVYDGTEISPNEQLTDAELTFDGDTP